MSAAVEKVGSGKVESPVGESDPLAELAAADWMAGDIGVDYPVESGFHAVEEEMMAVECSAQTENPDGLAGQELESENSAALQHAAAGWVFEQEDAYPVVGLIHHHVEEQLDFLAGFGTQGMVSLTQHPVELEY